VCVRIHSTHVQSRASHFKTTVVRGVGRNQVRQLSWIWFNEARSVAGPPQRHRFAVGFHAFENTSFEIRMALIALGQSE
jgi:hypothetical protein